MEREVISTCPVCDGRLQVTRLHCNTCGTTIEGEFNVGRFARLGRDQMSLLESFLRSRGNLRELERELGISYPTVRGRVETLLRVLGLGDGPAQPAEPAAAAEQTIDPEMRRSVLERLSRHELTAEQAAAALRGEEPAADTTAETEDAYMSDHPDFPDPTEIRHVIGAAGTFSLHNISGDISLRGVDGDEVVVRARSERGRGDWLPLVVRRGEGSLSIEIEQRGPLLFGLGWRHVPGIEFDVTLPRRARVDVNAVSSDIDARGLTGEQEFRTVSGDLDLSAEGGRVTITTVSGDARLVAAEPVEPRVSTTSGDVEILAPLIRALTVRTVSGDAELRAAFDAGAYHNVETVSGDVSINAQAGLTVEVKRGIDLSGNGGRQRVVGDGSARLRFRSLSGDLELSGERRQATDRPMPPVPPEAPQAPRPEQPNSLEILQALERGEIDVEEAARRLEGAGSHG